MIKRFLHKAAATVIVMVIVIVNSMTSCIEPPLKLPAQEVIVDMPMVLVDLDVVWHLDADWKTHWWYGWDETDRKLWGDIAYPVPSSYEVRRYFLGNETRVPHTNVDPFTIYGTHFRRTYEFGYYDMLIWSNIDSEDGTQVVTVNEDDLDEVKASTTVTRGMAAVTTTAKITAGTSILTGVTSNTQTSVVTGLYNQPEIFYSTYPRDIYISRFKEDYDYYDEQEKCWVKRINCELNPLVYLYLVQVIIKNNNGKIVGCTGDNAISSFSSGTSVNTGHTWNKPVMVYYGSRFKKDIVFEHPDTLGIKQGELIDIIGGRLTTYGLCDMDSYSETKATSIYNGTRTDLKNYLYVDVKFSNGAQATIEADVTKQCLEQAHGGIITVILDGNDIVIPPGPTPGGPSSLFVPTVEDYDEVVYDLVMGR